MDFEADGYEYWRNALDGVFGPVHDSDPQCGFWRLRAAESQNRRGAAKFVGAKAVAIWNDGSGIVASVDGMKADANDIWLLVAKYPVSEKDYREHRKSGIWSDIVKEWESKNERHSTQG